MMNQSIHYLGKVRKQDGAANTNYRYNQEYYDGESDLIYMRARVYDPFVGRFISRDPVNG